MDFTIKNNTNLFRLQNASNKYAAKNPEREAKETLYDKTNPQSELEMDFDLDMDIYSIGTIREAIKQKKAKDQMEDQITEDENKDLYDEKFTVCGVDYTNNPDGFKIIVPLPDEVKKQLDQFVRENFERQGHVSKYNMTLTDKRLAYEKKYLESLEQKDRPSALWTMAQYQFAKSDEIEAQVREKDPKWEWGQKIKPEILSEIFGDRYRAKV